MGVDRTGLLQQRAWVGDAVLSLWARAWLLERDRRMDAGRFARLTSNRFLACIGNPTEVEARYGGIYLENGLEAAFEVIERELVPLFEKQEKNRGCRYRTGVNTRDRRDRRNPRAKAPSGLGGGPPAC
jgi:dsRNA-specific ribonuclease